MKKGQKSYRGGYQDFLCPFTDMYITQGSNSNSSHRGIMANDVRGIKSGVRYPYYAPCDLKAVALYPSSGQVMWTSLNKVRFANGRIDYATIMTAHDDTMDAKIGQIVRQGNQLGNMGNKGLSSGIHCHIQISQGNNTKWYKKSSWTYNGRVYDIYGFENEYDLDDCYFIDDTNILNGMGGNWKKTTDIKVNSNEDSNKIYANLPPSINKWAVYKIDSQPIKKNAIAFLNPQKFGGLSYHVKEFRDGGSTGVIETNDFGRVKIYLKDTVANITVGLWTYEKGNK